MVGIKSEKKGRVHYNSVKISFGVKKIIYIYNIIVGKRYKKHAPEKKLN